MKRLLLVMIILLSGCGTLKKLNPFSNASVQEEVVNSDGTVTRTYQDEAKIERERQRGANMGMLYGACALMASAGGIALLFMKNKDPLILMFSGMAGAGMLVWFESAADIMAWVLPVLVVVSFVPFYLRWRNRIPSKLRLP